MIGEKLKKLLNEAEEKDCDIFIAEMKELLNEAEEKDVDALLELGKSYFSKEKDEEISDYLTNGQVAFALLARALLLDHENPTAQYLVGRCYFEGKGADKNTDEGLKWMEEAANQTPPYLFAVFTLYAYYNTGVDVPENHHKAANYLLGIKPYIELYKKGEYPANKRENPLKNCDVDFSEMLYYLGEYWCENNLPSQARPILKEAANLGSEKAKKSLDLLVAVMLPPQYTARTTALKFGR